MHVAPILFILFDFFHFYCFDVSIQVQVKINNLYCLMCQHHLCLWPAGYIGEFEYVDDHRSGKIVVELNGRLNKCGVISPRFDVGVKDIEPWTARLLPSRQVGIQNPLFFL